MEILYLFQKIQQYDFELDAPIIEVLSRQSQ